MSDDQTKDTLGRMSEEYKRLNLQANLKAIKMLVCGLIALCAIITSGVMMAMKLDGTLFLIIAVCAVGAGIS